LEPELLPNATLSEFYRFALLLTGDAGTAERIVTETLQDVAGRLSELRHESRRRSCVAAKIRERCLKRETGNAGEASGLVGEEALAAGGGPVLGAEALNLAQRFSGLPEPERTALALFYLNLFTPDEIASLLAMELDDLGPLLAGGRKRLAEALEHSA
jgi:DNA-directed RNA polymerase specialized sigma24 family protein